MEIVLAVLVLTFLVVGVVAVRVTRAVKRGVERVGGQARRSLSQAGLTARAAQPGPVGELARTRRDLRASVDSTRGVLEAGSAEDPALREALGLLDRLHEHARQLDRELGLLMEGEPDRDRVAAALPDLQERAARIRTSADSLRHAAQDRVRRHGAEELDTLHQQISLEADALRHWAPARPDSGSGPDAASRDALPPEQHRRQLFRRRRPQDAG